LAGLPVIVIRPQPGTDATLAAARALGLDARAFPLFEVRPLDWQAPPRGSIDALLVGSANVLRHAGPALEDYRGLPAYVVGETTAAAVRDAGFEVAAMGSGGLQGVLSTLKPGHLRLLRLAGRDRITLDPPPGTDIITRVVYASESLPMTGELSALLSRPALVLLHSGEAAAHFARCCDEAGIGRATIALAALAPRIAERADDGWAALEIAAEPSDAALLALADKMCQNRARVKRD